MSHLTDTIIAPATPQGHSAIAVIRLSGPDSIRITSEIFRGADLCQAASHTVHYGWVTDDEGRELDEVMVTVFRAPRTFTAEDCTEISCHGSPHLVQEIMTVAIKHGARPANPGEFTLRAFLNGRIDLSQAEAVADLIQSNSAKSGEIAIRQLKGSISGTLHDLRQQLVDFAALIELELDFSEEDVEFAHRGRLTDLVHKILNVTEPMAKSFQWGNSIREGIPVAIIGAPNAGKSTLLNTLLNEEKALVSDIAGTTRDFIEDTINIDGIIFRFIDTAGLRETTDILEGMGIERSRQKLREADIILFVADVTHAEEEIIRDFRDLELRPGQKSAILLNKSDLVSAAISQPKAAEISSITGVATMPVTARYAHTLGPLMKFLDDHIRSHGTQEGTVITNARHYDALVNTSRALHKVLKGLSSDVPSDLVALDIREALYHLGTITGEVVTDDLLDSIFSKFCIGK